MGLLASDAEKVIAVTAEAQLVDVPPIEAMSAEAAAFFTTPSVLSDRQALRSLLPNRQTT